MGPAGGSQVSGDPASRPCQGQCALWQGPPLTWPRPTTEQALCVGNRAPAHPLPAGGGSRGKHNLFSICHSCQGSVRSLRCPARPH